MAAGCICSDILHCTAFLIIFYIFIVSFSFYYLCSDILHRIARQIFQCRVVYITLNFPLWSIIQLQRRRIYRVCCPDGRSALVPTIAPAPSCTKLLAWLPFLPKIYLPLLSDTFWSGNRIVYHCNVPLVSLQKFYLPSIVICDVF